VAKRQTPSKLYPRKNSPWTLFELKQLGKVPDSVLARRTGRTIQAVVAERQRRRLRLLTLRAAGPPAKPGFWVAFPIASYRAASAVPKARFAANACG